MNDFVRLQQAKIKPVFTLDIDISNYLPVIHKNIFNFKIYNTVYEYMYKPTYENIEYRSSCLVQYLTLDCTIANNDDLIEYKKKLARIFSCLCDLEIIKGVMGCFIFSQAGKNKYCISIFMATKLDIKQLNSLFGVDLFAKEGGVIENFDWSKVNSDNFYSSSFDSHNNPKKNDDISLTAKAVAELLSKDEDFQNKIKNLIRR